MRASTFSGCGRWSRPAYWTTVPFHAIGMASSSVSSRGSSKPSPMKRPVASTRRGSSVGRAANRARASRRRRGVTSPWSATSWGTCALRRSNETVEMIPTLRQDRSVPGPSSSSESASLAISSSRCSSVAESGVDLLDARVWGQSGRVERRVAANHAHRERVGRRRWRSWCDESARTAS